MLIGSVEASLLVLLAIVVFGPIIAERFRIPGIVGLIFGGMAAGPFVLGWLPAGGLVTQLGAIGILFLMFLAGLGFDIRSFAANRNNAIAYGLLGFVIPFGLSIAVAFMWADIGILGAALVGAMWASNTLVAYPDVKAAGLQDNRAVSAAVSAGVVADLLSLTVLALVTTSAVIDIEESQVEVRASVENPTLPLWIAFPVLIAFTIWLLPKVTQWFFVNVGRTRTQRFVFVLGGMAAGATVALIGGIEGLIGAFLAGLGMNRLIPAEGQLMDRLDFVGSTIFVPAFLVSIGLNIDPTVLFDLDTVVLGLVFTGLVVVGKSSAAIITKFMFDLSWPETGLMSSLSFGQAASTLAIAQVGLELNMFDQDVVNAAVLAIVFTALLTTYGTRWFIGLVPRIAAPSAPVGKAVLVDVRPNGSDMDTLMAFAGAVARADDGLVVPYAVPGPGQSAVARAVVDRAVEVASAHGLDSEGIVRVDESFADGTLSLTEERDASLVMLAWQGPRFASDFVFGNDIDGIGERSPVPSMAARILRPWSRIVVATGSLTNDWHRDDAMLVLAVLRRVRRRSDAPVVVITPDRGFAEPEVGEDEGVTFVTNADERRGMLEQVGPDDLVLAPAHVIHDLPPVMGWRIARSLQETNLAVVAGPHRLSISRGPTRTTMQSVVHTVR